MLGHLGWVQFYNGVSVNTHKGFALEILMMIDSFPCFTRLNPCVAHCSTDSIPWVHHSREEGSLDYDGGFVHLQIHMNFDTIIHRQHPFQGPLPPL
jgi:hypothetical protein